MKKSMMMTLSCLACLSFSGCYVVGNDPPGCLGGSCAVDPGEIWFYWSFEDAFGSVTDICTEAEVSRVGIYIYDDQGYLEFDAERPCGDFGAIIDNFYPGNYEIQLIGLCRAGWITHESWYQIDIDPGINDFGTLVLDYQGPCS